jgi:hypothetical protein
MSLSSLSDDVTKYLRLGDLYRIEVYLSQSSGGWEVQEHGTDIFWASDEGLFAGKTEKMY